MKSHFVLIHLSVLCLAEGYYLTVEQNGPIVTGATITLAAELFNSDGSKPTGTFRFKWNDDAEPQHSTKEEGEITKSSWNITYPASLYAPGTYEVKLVVEGYMIIHYEVISQAILINVTAYLNGDLELSQENNSVRTGSYVSNHEEVTHSIVLSPPDRRMIERRNLTVRTYWFLDCVYLGVSDDYTFRYNYSRDDVEDHSLSVMLIAANETEPVDVRTTTTAVTPTTPATNGSSGQDIFSNDIASDSGGPTTTTTTTTTQSAVTAITTQPMMMTTSTTTTTTTTTTVQPLTTTPLPPLCPNSSSVVTDRNKTYGFFYKTVKLQSPVNNVVVSGSSWLKHDVLLNLTVSCQGSPPFSHCVKILKGQYNSTGLETCNKVSVTPTCQIHLLHYFDDPNTYTLLFVIGNNVSRTVTPFGVNIFEVKKHAQLSVIVVPVTCSVVAVILIVFGVAYYIQSRRRYTVEVADFDFSKSGDDTEYRTFRERLSQAIMTALNRSVRSDMDYSSLSNDTQ